MYMIPKNPAISCRYPPPKVEALRHSQNQIVKKTSHGLWSIEVSRRILHICEMSPKGIHTFALASCATFLWVLFGQISFSFLFLHCNEHFNWRPSFVTENSKILINQTLLSFVQNSSSALHMLLLLSVWSCPNNLLCATCSWPLLNVINW